MRRYWFVPLWAYRLYIRLSARRLRRELKRDSATPEELAQLEALTRDALSKWEPAEPWSAWRAGR